jgi:hypothetical protein
MLEGMTVESYNKTILDATSKFKGSHPTKLLEMESGPGSETDPEVAMAFKVGVNNRLGIR